MVMQVTRFLQRGEDVYEECVRTVPMQCEYRPLYASQNGPQLVDHYQRYAEASISRCSRLELHSALVIHRV